VKGSETEGLGVGSARTGTAREAAARRRREYVAEMERELESIVGQLRSIPEVRSVILFGSWARGRRDLGADLDLMVVMESSQDFVTRCAGLAGRLRTGAPLDLLVYTPEEIERCAGRPFFRRALAEGKVLYAR
jgi:predicted nucleotidyltransferase